MMENLHSKHQLRRSRDSCVMFKKCRSLLLTRSGLTKKTKNRVWWKS